jgi:hypothetical protein
VILVSSTYSGSSNRAALVTIRVLSNTLIAYCALALVAFVFALITEFGQPSRYDPYLGQAAGSALFTTGLMSLGSPLVLAGSLLLDIALRGFARPRRAVAILALLPPACFLLLVPSNAAMAVGYAAATLSIGLLTARCMLLPRPNPLTSESADRGGTPPA